LLRQEENNMTKQIKNIIRGVGSLLDVAPSTDYSEFVPKESTAERIHKSWTRTGESIQRSLNHFANSSSAHEQEKAAK
jgi:hypothetical protein